MNPFIQLNAYLIISGLFGFLKYKNVILPSSTWKNTNANIENIIFTIAPYKGNRYSEPFLELPLTILAVYNIIIDVII
jgi:hypothetical protein